VTIGTDAMPRDAPGPVIGVAFHHLYPDIVVITYGCYPQLFTELRVSEEHAAVGQFRLDQLDGLSIASGYRRSIVERAAGHRSAARR
jgi:hypothetical protein